MLQAGPPTSQNSLYANFAESPKGEVRRIPLVGNWAKRCLEIAPLPLLLKVAVNSHSGGWTDKRGPSPGSLLYQPFEVAHHNRRSCYVSRPGSQLLDLARRVRHRRRPVVGGAVRPRRASAPRVDVLHQ